MKTVAQSPMVACVGNANDPNTFGGLPYHLIEAGRMSGLIKSGFSFRTSQTKLKFAKYFWNGSQYVRTGRFGGFQYSEIFLRKLWESAPEPRGNAAVLNVFQLFPQSEMERKSAKYFYLDQTLQDLFDYYGNGKNLPESWRENILTRERLQYAAADKVIFRSHWAAERAKVNYGLSDDKVAVVLPGANIPQATLTAFDSDDRISNAQSRQLRLVFVGKEWQRKGLDRLLGAMRLAKMDGAQISLTVIGSQPDDVPQKLTEGLEIDWLGFFDKSRDPLRFARLLARHDIGVLLSRSEAGGVSLREFGRVGLPVIAPNTGGSPEFAMSDAAKLFSPDDPDEAIAEVLVNFAADRRGLGELKRDAWERRHEFDWTAAVERISYFL